MKIILQKIINLCILVLLLSGFVSCKKYLAEKPDKSLVVPATLSDLQALMDDSYSMNLARTPSLPESSSDDFFLTMDNYNNNNDNQKAAYTWSLKEYSFENDWSDAYLPVYNANVCLQTIAGIPRTNNNQIAWDNVKGSALFYRAYYYLGLTWEFSKAYDSATATTDAGIVLRDGTDLNVPSVRSSVKETYNRITSDAREAIDALPEHRINLLRPSKGAAYGLLVRAFLSMREYDSAYRYANLFLQSDSVLLDYNTLDVTSTTPFPRFDNPETVFYTEMNGNNGLHGTYQAYIDTVLYSSYEEEDVRKKAFFFDNGGYHAFKGSYTQNPYVFFTGIATDEILLTRAECFARKGMVVQAMNDLNRLLMKRWDNTLPYAPVTASTQEEALDKILLERRKELLMRGLRWMDIKRLNKERRNIIPQRIVNNVLYQLLPNDPRYALPIPIDIIRTTGIAQN